VLNKAILFATKAHRGQKRKGSGLPYIVHPLEVMHILLRHGIRDNATLAAALLHDVVEDCEVSPRKLKRRFGAKVATTVLALTKPPAKKGRDVKALALDQVRRGSRAARMAKMADRLSNLRDLDQTKWTREYKLEYLAEGEKIARICRRALPALADELRAMVAHQRGLLGPK
jgi:(p)ppGpp synthase/HD superfamily hydrolase